MKEGRKEGRKEILRAGGEYFNKVGATGAREDDGTWKKPVIPSQAASVTARSNSCQANLL